MGSRNWIAISDPVLAHKIFMTHGADTSNRSHVDFTDRLSRNGRGLIFSQPGEGFKENRRRMTEVISVKNLDKYKDFMDEQADKLLAGLLDFSNKQGFLNPRLLFEFYSFSIIVMIGFGKRYSSIGDKDFLDLANLVLTAEENIGIKGNLSNYIPILAILDHLVGKKKKIDNLIYNKQEPLMRTLLKEALECSESNMVKSIKESGTEMDEDNTIVLSFDLIGGGSLTVSITLEWVIAILCHYPDVQDRVRVELDQFMLIHKRFPAFKEREKTPYSYAVLREVLRYRTPVAFGGVHQTRNDIEVDGYFIPCGSYLFTSMDSVHRNTTLYDEPEKFKPERFLKFEKPMSSTANGKLDDRDHFAFGWGRRTCPGIYLVDLELYNAFVRIYSTCIIEPEAELPDITTFFIRGVTRTPKDLKVKFYKRPSKH
ncbi:cytochrome P450 [Pilobolus umbonatus]|nr:cytochrome P450 [Pilobolus umbonatus]